MNDNELLSLKKIDERIDVLLNHPYFSREEIINELKHIRDDLQYFIDIPDEEEELKNYIIDNYDTCSDMLNTFDNYRPEYIYINCTTYLGVSWETFYSFYQKKLGCLCNNRECGLYKE